MPELPTYSFLQVDYADETLVPEKVKKACPNIKWDEYKWDAIGLPANGATFSLLKGMVLYREKESDNSPIKPERSDFTGEVKVIGQFYSDETNFYVVNKLVFYNGELKSTTLEMCQEFDAKEQRAAAERSAAQVKERIRVLNSWWYKYLYSPWKFLIKVIATLLIMVLIVIREVIVFIANLLAPL